MHPQRNLIEAANEIVKEQTNMGAVARTGINALSRYKSTAGLNTLEDRLRNAHSKRVYGDPDRDISWDHAEREPAPLDPSFWVYGSLKDNLDRAQYRIDNAAEIRKDEDTSREKEKKNIGSVRDSQRIWGDRIERLIKADRNRNVS